jgi:hypothetical protein
MVAKKRELSGTDHEMAATFWSAATESAASGGMGSALPRAQPATPACSALGEAAKFGAGHTGVFGAGARRTTAGAAVLPKVQPNRPPQKPKR